jgi:hypothetical protein
MAKDPAFLFYSKDWVMGTAEMMPEEKGVYIDLLVHQHQNGSIPSDIKRLSRIVRLSEETFNLIWKNISNKFIPNGEANGERLVNRKLCIVMEERSNKGHKNTIIGTFASLIRTRNEPFKIKNQIKKEFDVNLFIGTNSERITERLTEWYEKRLKSIVNANEDVIDNKTPLKDKKDEIPKKEEFLIYCKSVYDNMGKSFDDYKFAAELKYDSWVLNNWKDGNDNPIKNWKSKVNNTIPYLTANAKQPIQKANQPYF